METKQRNKPGSAAKATRPKLSIDTNGIDVKSYLQQYQIITGKPIGLPSWLIDLANENGGEITVEIVKLNEIRTSNDKKWALSIFTVEVDNKTASVLLPMGVFLSDGSAVLGLGKTKDGRPIFNLLFISKGDEWIPSDEITEEEILALFE